MKGYEQISPEELNIRNNVDLEINPVRDDMSLLTERNFKQLYFLFVYCPDGV